MNTYCKIFALSSYLALSLSLAGYSFPSESGNLPPVAIISNDPGGEWFYNAGDIVFSMSSSYDPDGGYINYTKWYINGVYQTGGSYGRNMPTCFVLHDEPNSNGCYELGQGISTVTVKLELRDNAGDWSSTTETYTIKVHKGRRYFVKDHLGSVRATVNRDGNVLVYDDYYPFGLTMPGRSSNSANPNDNYKFTGYEEDDEVGLTMYHANARGYDPVLGRFMQIDPLTEKFPSLSPFSYVANNPLILIDPTGEEWFYYQADGEDDRRWHYHEDTSELEVWTGEYDDDGNKVMETQLGMIQLLEFNGESLTWYQEDGLMLAYYGVSGVLGEEGETDPTQQTNENVGPIPEGWYIADPRNIQDWENLSFAQKMLAYVGRGQWPGGTRSWGESRLFLSPEKVDNRSGFSIHGGKVPGSRGCVDLCGNGTWFFNAFRKHPTQVGLLVNYQIFKKRKK